MKKTLRQYIDDQGRTISWIAKQIDMSQPLLSMQLNGKATLHESTVDSVCKLLGLNKEEVLWQS